MTDAISRQQAIDALRDYLAGKRCPDDGTLTCRLIENEVINKLPLIQLRTGKWIDTGSNEISVIVEVDRKRNIYQKHLIYLNEWTMYTVEDVSGANVSKYAYEVEFMPQTIRPVRITSDELSQDIEQIYNNNEEEGNE